MKIFRHWLKDSLSFADLDVGAVFEYAGDGLKGLRMKIPNVRYGLIPMNAWSFEHDSFVEVSLDARVFVLDATLHVGEEK